MLDESPFIARSILYFTGQESGLSADVRGKKGKIGPSADYPNQLLSTCVFWWGDSGEAADPNGARHPSYRDDRGNEVGTMFVAIATADGTHVKELHLGARPVRARLRTQTGTHAFDLARRYLSGLPYEETV